jgi:anti-anti-sigma factor
VNRGRLTFGGRRISAAARRVRALIYARGLYARRLYARRLYAWRLYAWRPRPRFRAVVTSSRQVRLTISGELDVTTTRTLARRLAALARLEPTGLIIDLAAVSYVDCATARLLVGASALLPPDEPLVLSGLQPPVRRLLELIGLAELVEIRD